MLGQTSGAAADFHALAASGHYQLIGGIEARVQGARIHIAQVQIQPHHRTQHIPAVAGVGVGGRDTNAAALGHHGLVAKTDRARDINLRLAQLDLAVVEQQAGHGLHRVLLERIHFVIDHAESLAGA